MSDFPPYDDHGQKTTTIGDLKRWLRSLDESAEMNNLPPVSDDTPIEIGPSYNGTADIFVHFIKGVRHSFGFFDRKRDKAFHDAAQRFDEAKTELDEATHQLYVDLWDDYPEFRRSELDTMLGRRT